jgi:transposase
MPRFNSTLNLPGFSIIKASGLKDVTAELRCHLSVRCPHCRSGDLRKKDRYRRHIRHESVGLRQVTLVIEGVKYQCRSCQRYFRQRFPGLLPYRRATEALRKEVYTLHREGVSQVDLGRRYRMSGSTVERWFHECYERDDRELRQRDCPQVLGIDEHSFSSRQGYATTFCDLRKHKVFDVVKGKSAASLHDYLMSLTGRDKVRVVCMDMSVTYRSIIRKYFPNAKIVADRFHVVRLLGHMFLKTCQQIDPASKNQRGILKILRKKPENLTDKEKPKLEAYLLQHPAIRALYDFKQRLHRLLLVKRQTARQTRQIIPQLLAAIEQLKQSGFAAMRTLGNSFDDWKDEIGRMWRFTKSNGITEGFHRKMKLIQRRAYGFKNFENYRLRVRILCG